jgi:GGDEF domain-containing protein
MTTNTILTQCPDCRDKDETIRMLRWNPTLNMLRAAGLDEAIRRLPDTTTYTVVLCDVDRMKAINAATGNHVQTDRYLAAGFAVRQGEIAGQLHDKGDEFGFVIDEQSAAKGRRRHNSAGAFVARIARQLAGQSLTISERYALAAAQGCHVSEARLSATFATRSGLTAAQVPGVIEVLSKEVLELKGARADGR